MSSLARANACFILGLLCLLAGVPMVLWGMVSPSVGFISNKDLDANIIRIVFGVALSGAGWWFFGKASHCSNDATRTNEEDQK